MRLMVGSSPEMDPDAARTLASFVEVKLIAWTKQTEPNHGILETHAMEQIKPIYGTEYSSVFLFFRNLITAAYYLWCGWESETGI